MIKLLIVVLILSIPITAFAEDYEFLVEIEAETVSKVGTPITFKPVGWDWGRMERQNYGIVTVRGITYEQAQEYSSFKDKTVTAYEDGKEIKYQPRKYNFKLNRIKSSDRKKLMKRDKKKKPVDFKKEDVELNEE